MNGNNILHDINAHFEMMTAHAVAILDLFSEREAIINSTIFYKDRILQAPQDFADLPQRTHIKEPNGDVWFYDGDQWHHLPKPGQLTLISRQPEDFANYPISIVWAGDNIHLEQAYAAYDTFLGEVERITAVAFTDDE